MATVRNFTLDVLNPESRLQEIRPYLAGEDKAAVFDKVIGINFAETYGKYGSNPSSERRNQLKPLLQPGEYAAMIEFNDTSDLGFGRVYQKQADGTIAVVFEYSENIEVAGARGDEVANQIFRRFGFRPVTRYRSSYPTTD